MKWMRKSARGFTLVELMVVVALMGVLAALAIPNYLYMQLRSKRAELPVNIDGIRHAEKSYEAEYDVFTSCSTRPATIPGRSLVDFGASAGDQSDWDLMGWIPDGKVRGQYSVTAVNGSAQSNNFTALAVSDLDVNGQTAAYMGDRTNYPSMVSSQSAY